MPSPPLPHLGMAGPQPGSSTRLAASLCVSLLAPHTAVLGCLPPPSTLPHTHACLSGDPPHTPPPTPPPHTHTCLPACLPGDTPPHPLTPSPTPHPLQEFSDVFPHLVTATNVPRLTKIDDVEWGAVDAVFCCLPHATTQEVVAGLPKVGPAQRLCQPCARQCGGGALCPARMCSPVCGSVVVVVVVVVPWALAPRTHPLGPPRPTLCLAPTAPNVHAPSPSTLPPSSLPQHIKIVDLSADFRLRDVNTYAQWWVLTGGPGGTAQ